MKENLFCAGNKTTNTAYRDNYSKIFKKAIPKHQLENKDRPGPPQELIEDFIEDIEEDINELTK
jgi:hypothetical protein